MLQVIDERGRSHVLEAPLASGAEGEIRPIRGNPDRVAKNFLRPDPEMADKLSAMMQSPPRVVQSRAICFAWPEQLLFTPGRPRRFVGYVMAHILRKRVLHATLQRIRKDPTPFPNYALQAAENIAGLAAAAHSAGYVIGDINEKNILTGGDGSAAIVDTDSFQVRVGRKTFYCGVGRPEYTAPELHRKPLTSTIREPSQDSFALGVVIFQLLMQGDHPFRCHYTGAGNPPPLQERIARGLWPFAAGGLPLYEPPRGWSRFRALPSEIQTLFQQCFEEGQRDPLLRPAADDWMQTLALVRGQWAGPVSRAQRGRRAWPSRQIAAVGAGMLAATGLVGAAIWSLGIGDEKTMAPATNSEPEASGEQTPELWMQLGARGSIPP